MFRSIWCSCTFFFLAVVLNFALAIHFFTWYVRVHESRTLSAIQTSFYLGALGGVLVWMWLHGKHAEKRNLYMAGTLATAGILCGASLFFGEGRLFGTGNATPLLIGHIVAGLFGSSVWVLPGSMLADVTDQDELVTGMRREGIFFGIELCEKIASGVALLLAGVLLNFFVGLEPGAASQTATAVERLGLLFGLLPGLMLVIAVSFILPYGLNRRAVRSIQQQLVEGRKEQAHA